jgi:hypothetical protein
MLYHLGMVGNFGQRFLSYFQEILLNIRRETVAGVFL